MHANHKKVEPVDDGSDFPRKSRAHTPTYFETIRWDPTLHMPLAWRESQLKDQSRWTRKYLLPTVKVICYLLIRVTRVLKRIVPFKIYSWKALNFLSEWFVKNCMSAEAQEVLFRHFALEANVVNFIAKNVGANDVEDVGLYPRAPEELGDWGGHNATLLHDCNIMNLFIDLGKSSTADVTQRKDKQDIDFSMLKIPKYKINPDPSSRLFNLDLETSLYIMVLFLVFLFDEDVAESAANSLTLDESVVNILANITGDEQYRNWSPYRYTSRVYWPADPALGLHEHIMIFEYIYVRLSMMRDGVKNPLLANIQ